MNKPDKTPAYYINGKRLSQLKRPALLVLARELHELMEAQMTRANDWENMAHGYKESFDDAVLCAQHAELDRDTALAELSISRDKAIKHLWDLGVVGSELSMERARVVSRDERIAFLRKRVTLWKRFKYFCFGVLCISTSAAILEHLWL